MKVHIRLMISRDMPEVIAIENRSFEFSWTEADFLTTLKQRNVIAMVAEVGDAIVGFMLYELHKSSLTLLTFAVHPQYCRQGIGSLMVKKLTEKLSPHRRTSIVLNVRESNLAAQLFFRSQGFEAIEILRGYYADSGEDAYRMCFFLEAPVLCPSVH